MGPGAGRPRNAPQQHAIVSADHQEVRVPLLRLGYDLFRGGPGAHRGFHRQRSRRVDTEETSKLGARRAGERRFRERRGERAEADHEHRAFRRRATEEGVVG